MIDYEIANIGAYSRIPLEELNSRELLEYMKLLCKWYSEVHNEYIKRSV